MNNMNKRLTAFDEATDVQCQEHCQKEIGETLLEILGLVVIAEIPDGTKIHLIDGLNHIRSHVTAQTQLLTSEITGRAN